MMKKTRRSVLTPYNEIMMASYSQQSDYDELVDPAEVIKVLQDQRTSLQNFLLYLGAAAAEAIDLRKYAEDIVNICELTSVDGQKIIELANNTIRKMKNNKRLKRNWNKEDLTILLWVIEHYNRLNHKHPDLYVDSDWKYVAELVPGKSDAQCMFKWLGLKKYNLTEFPWAENEENMLRQLVQDKGKNRWIEISQELYLHNKVAKIYRSPKQCREHWTCYMDPELKKGPWRPQEDLHLLKEYLRLGKRWSEIAKKLHGRTENAVKNRFNLLMAKQERSQGRKRSHQYFTNLWISQLELQIQRNPGLATLSEEDEPEPKLKLQNRAQISNNPDEFINQFTKTEFSTDTYMTEHESKVTVVMESDEKGKHTSVRFIKFKKIPLSELLKMQDLFPAAFEQQTMQISYRTEPEIPAFIQYPEVKDEDIPYDVPMLKQEHTIH